MGAQVFIAHSSEDAPWLQRLTTMLAPLGRFGLSFWDESQVLPGQHRPQQIATALADARVAVLLVSPEFLAFNTVFAQELTAMWTAPSAKPRPKILWVVVRACLWGKSSLTQYQPASDPDKPLAGLSDSEADQVLVKVCQHIHAAVGSSMTDTEYAAVAAGSEGALATLAPEGVASSHAPSSSSRPRLSPPPKSAYDAAWYLERADEEARARAAWEAPGAPVVLKAPELFGKTWLLMRLLTELKQRGRR